MKFIKIAKRKPENIKKELDKNQEKLNRLMMQKEKLLDKIKSYNFNPDVFGDWRNASNSDEAFTLDVKYSNLKDDIESVNRQIKRLTEEYEQTQTTQISKPEVLEVKEGDIPAVLKEYQQTLEEELFEEDVRLKQKFKEDYKILGYEAYCNKYKGHIAFANSLRDLPIEKIKSNSKKRAEQFVTDLYKKIKEKVGHIRYCALYFNGRDINGRIYGENCDLHLTTIVAGGYNIQRLHNRYLIKELKKENK